MKKLITSITLGMILFSCIGQSLNLEINNEYRQKITNKESMLMTIDGEEGTIGTTTKYDLLYTVKEENDANYKIEVIFEYLCLINHIEQGDLEYNSEKDNPYDMLSSILKGIKNKPFIIILNKNGSIVEISGLEPIFTESVAKIDNLMETQQLQFKNMMIDWYGKNELTKVISLLTNIYPTNSTDFINSWQVNYNFTEDIATNYSIQYALTEKKSDYYIINGEADLQTLRKNSNPKNSDVKYDMSGKLNTSLKVNKQTGWVINATINQKLSGETTIKGEKDLPKHIPMTISNEIEVNCCNN